MKRLRDSSYIHLVSMLRRHRVASGLSQGDLARRLGKQQSWVSKIESGERRLDLVEFLRLCEAAGIDAASFLDDLRVAMGLAPSSKRTVK